MKTISIRIKPHGREFVATVIGSTITSRTVGEVSVMGPRLVQRIGESEYAAARAALHDLFHGEGIEPDSDAPDYRALLTEIAEDAELVDDPNGAFGCLVSPALIARAKEASK